MLELCARAADAVAGDLYGNGHMPFSLYGFVGQIDAIDDTIDDVS